jgi:hypothetical protein
MAAQGSSELVSLFAKACAWPFSDNHAAVLRLTMPSWTGHIPKYAKIAKPNKVPRTDKRAGFLRFCSLSQCHSRYVQACAIRVTEAPVLNEFLQVSLNGRKYSRKPTAV